MNGIRAFPLQYIRAKNQVRVENREWTWRAGEGGGGGGGRAGGCLELSCSRWCHRQRHTIGTPVKQRCCKKSIWETISLYRIIISTRHSTLATTFQWDRVDPLGLRYSPAKEFGLIGSKARLLWIGVMIWHMIHIISYRYQHANVQADLLLGILVFPSKRFRVKTRLEGPMVVTHFIGLCLASWDAIEPG